MPLPKELTTVTPLSKAVTLLLFILLPMLSFLFGMNYQNIINNLQNINNQQKACTFEAKICPHGSAVGRTGPNCEFAPCPTLAPSQKAICGGIAGIKCPEGYECQFEGNYPDAGGVCVKTSNKLPKPTGDFECPTGSYVDCMPGPDRLKKTECTPQYLQWAQENCLNFKGAAY